MIAKLLKQWEKKYKITYAGKDDYFPPQVVKQLIIKAYRVGRRELIDSAESHEIVKLSCAQVHPKLAVHHPEGHEVKYYRIREQNES